MDADAVHEADPARLERVLGARRNETACQLSCPGAVRDVPGWIDHLLVDVVQAGGCVESDHPDRDRIGLRAVQALEEAELETLAIDGDHCRVTAGQLADGDRRRRPTTGGDDGSAGGSPK